MFTNIETLRHYLNMADWYHLLPPHVKAILQRLQEHNFVVYVVGGAVRDLILGETPKDYDLVTNATPDQISALFSKTIDVGKHFGISIIIIDGLPTEVATFRREGIYEDARRPEHIILGATPQQDASRRDFTINGLFWDPQSGEVLDYVEGLRDIANRRIRTIGPPEERFGEDALRILRALRFEAQLAKYHFKIEPETLRAITKLCPYVLKVSRERITQEMQLILKSPKPSLALKKISDIGLWQNWFGTLEVGSNTLRVLDTLGPEASAQLRWAALIYETKKIDLESFVLPREILDKVQTILVDRQSIATAPSMELAPLKEFLAEESTKDALQLYSTFYEHLDAPRADAVIHGLNFCRESLKQFGDRLDPTPLLAGRDLLNLGFAPGPKIKAVLEEIRRAQLEEKIATRDEAIALAQNYRVR